MTSFTISEWHAYKNANAKAFRQIDAIDQVAKKNNFTSNTLPNILAILKIINFQDSKKANEADRAEAAGEYNEMDCYLLPSVGLARLVSDDVSLYKDNEVTMSVQFERMINVLGDSECKGLSSNDVIFTWLTGIDVIPISQLITLFFMFDRYGFEDKDDIYKDIKQKHQKAIDLYISKTTIKCGCEFRAKGKHEYELNEVLTQDEAFKIDIRNQEWVRFVGLILSQL